MSAGLLVWETAGRPDPASGSLLVDESGVCALCGVEQPRTAPAKKALGGNFTDQYLFRRSDAVRVCAGCLWVCSGKPPATLRMWSVVCTPGLEQPPSHEKAWLRDTPGLCLTNRADPLPVVRLLTNPPDGQWLCTVAVSSQKHVLPYAQVNTGAGRWTVRMENTDVTSTPAEFAAVLEHAAALRKAGHSPECVLTNTPSPAQTRTTAGLDLWREHATALTPYHEGPLLQLALWCLTKGTWDDLPI